MAAWSMSATARSGSSGSCAGADGDEAGGAKDAVTGGQFRLLLEDVVVLGGLLGVLDLAEPLVLGSVGDVLGLLLADVRGGQVVGAHGRVEQCEGSAHS